MNSSHVSHVPSPRSLRALDVLIFIQVGIGPFLAIYLQSVRNWNATRIGSALAVAGFAGMFAHMPVGALIDRLHRRRELYALGAALAALGSVATVKLSSFPQILAVQMLLGLVSAIFPPAIAAMSLGMVGRDGLDPRIGRNETFNHAGNVVLAASMGLFGYAFAPAYMFYFAATLSLMAAVCVFCIRARDINHDWARGANGVPIKPANHPTHDGVGFTRVLADRRLIVFALSVMLFHLANAAMLPLAGQRLSLGHTKAAPLYMAICIIVAQLLMTLLASPASRFAGTLGRKRVFLVALGVLPLRGLLFALNPTPFFTIMVQLLDGVSAAIFGVVSVLIVADLTRGTGHFNFTQGLIAAATGIGASLSTVVAGCLVQRSGFDAAFLALAVLAGTALLLFALAMPETKLTENNRSSIANNYEAIPECELTLPTRLPAISSDDVQIQNLQQRGSI